MCFGQQFTIYYSIMFGGDAFVQDPSDTSRDITPLVRFLHCLFGLRLVYRLNSNLHMYLELKNMHGII